VRTNGLAVSPVAGMMIKAIRAALAAPPPAPEAATQAAAAPFDGYPRPTCGTGRLRITTDLAPLRRGQGVMTRPARA